jgi:hypothetical protein
MKINQLQNTWSDIHIIIHKECITPYVKKNP